ncbi:MAG: pentapeptide repeat-containing protein, partial [Rhodococcus sp. (in: high G+C Gram-positive bacteria)]|uniref:pentapeptide repeat-containing protein n=1 Tax=Rhodococcus sp. TaxID=1831 RepID=UPI003D9B15C4
HARVALSLRQVSEEVRAGYREDARATVPDAYPGADLAGRDLRAHSLCGADLRGACLIAADLRGSTLAGVDLLGADLRDARIEGADLSTALYVTQPQIAAARGSADTTLPHRLSPPAHWGS